MKFYALLVLTILASLTTIHASAQAPTAAEIFARTPSTSFFLVDSVTGLDMLDYYRSGIDRPSSTVIGGSARIIDEEPLSLKLRIGESTDYQIAVLPAKNDTVVAVIETLSSSIPDSRIEFYNIGWQPVNNPDRLFKAPSLSEWLTPEGKKDKEYVELTVPFLFTSYSYDPADGILTLTDNTPEYFYGDEREKVSRMLRRSLKFRWNGSKFVTVKQ